jgi:hypothetical protein
MKHLVCVLTVFILANSALPAVDTTEISGVRQRATDAASAVSETDQAVIAKFWRTCLDRMFLAPKTEEVVEVRRQLKEQKGTENLSLYVTAYISEAVKDLSTAFENAERIENSDRKALVNRNLIILVAELENVKLAPFAMERIGDSDDVVRYWAVKTLTQPGIIRELTQGITPDPQMTETIAKALLERALAEPMPEIKKMMIAFAGSVDAPTARQFLTTLADSRIEAYKNWSVKDETLDISLLNAMGGVAVNQQGEIKSLFGRKFAELYALVFQRYLKGQTSFSSETVERLTTVIVEVDQNCVDSVMGIKTGVLAAIRRKTGLDREYETLFGNRMMAGELAAKFRFDYGKDASGKAITAPPELGPIPVPAAGQ